MGFDAIKIE